MTRPRDSYEPLYEPLYEQHPRTSRWQRSTSADPVANDDARSDARQSSEDEALLGKPDEAPFSWFEYIIFCLLGIAMLWAWNMFLAAAPYFASRLVADPWIAANFQSAVLAVSTITNLLTVLVLSRIQSSASYARRINLALVLNTLVFAALTVSTRFGAGGAAEPGGGPAAAASPKQYLAFLLLMVGAASYASGLLQNGGYAFVAGFGRQEYMQAIIAGQGIAGVLPAVAQVVSVVMYPPSGSADNSSSSSNSASDMGDDGSGASSGAASSAFAYFMAAVVMSALTLLAMHPLSRRHRALTALHPAPPSALEPSSSSSSPSSSKPIPLSRLFLKLRWLSSAVVLLFTTTMFFPVFTTKIPSLHPTPHNPLSQPLAFIPLAFFAWNLGDLSGRVLTLRPSCALTRRPALLFALSVARIAQLPLYMLCNVGGRGAPVPSDAFYLVVVQFGFGLSNGWLFSSIMMASGEWVREDEREAAGGFMGLCLVAGLAAGSLLSFTASGI